MQVFSVAQQRLPLCDQVLFIEPTPKPFSDWARGVWIMQKNACLSSRPLTCYLGVALDDNSRTDLQHMMESVVYDEGVLPKLEPLAMLSPTKEPRPVRPVHALLATCGWPTPQPLLV